MKNNLFDSWIYDADYFSTLAVLSCGPLHPGGLAPNQLLGECLNWKNVDVLDLGAGTGTSHRYFTALGANVHSAEPNYWMRRAAEKSGVNPRHIHAVAAEDITATWLDGKFQSVRVLVQGVTGFLSEGLDTLCLILQQPCVTEVVLVEWIGDQTAGDNVPLKRSYRASDYVAALEKVGLNAMWLQTLSYQPPDNRVSQNELRERVEWHFEEAREIDWGEAVSAKVANTTLPSLQRKNYIVLVGSRDKV